MSTNDYNSNENPNRIDVPDTLPENEGANPNEVAVEQHIHEEIPKVYGPARPHNIKRKISLKDKLPFKKDRDEVVVVYGPAEWFEPKQIEKEPKKPEKPDGK